MIVPDESCANLITKPSGKVFYDFLENELRPMKTRGGSANPRKT